MAYLQNFPRIYNTIMRTFRGKVVHHLNIYWIDCNEENEKLREMTDVSPRKGSSGGCSALAAAATWAVNSPGNQ